MRLIDVDYLKNTLNSGGGESVDINISKRMPLGEIVDTVIQAYRKCLLAELEKTPTVYEITRKCTGCKHDESDKCMHCMRAYSDCYEVDK